MQKSQMTDSSSTPIPPESPQAAQPEAASPSSPEATQQQAQPTLAITPQVLGQILQAQLGQQRGGVLNFGQPIAMGGPPLLMAAQVQQVQQMQHWQGPYPPPEAVERYEKALPGTFDRMIKMAEQLQAAQIDEAKEIRSMTHRDQQRGHYLGFLTAVGAMIGGLICLKFDSPWLGAVFLSVPVMGVAKALIESTLATRAQNADPGIAPVPTPAPQPPAPPQAPTQA